MIQKNVDIKLLKDIFSEYKNNYIYVPNDFTNIYAYILDDNVVGFLIFSIMYDKCEIIDIFVRREYRRNHIAQKLLSEIEKDYSIENITLEVAENNIVAIRLYEKLGFKIVAIRDKYYDDCNGLLMLKEVR